MKRRKFIKHTAVATAGLGLASRLPAVPVSGAKQLTVGVIGLDTSHSTAFSKIINQAEAGSHRAACKVTHAYPHGSPDIESSVSRIPGYTKDIKELGVSVTDSIEELLEKVDAVLLETNDGRPHLEQAMKVFKAGKPVFIDKPIAASLEDTLEIFKQAEAHKVPVFTSSSLRFSPVTQKVARGEVVGKIIGADTFSPAKLEPTHPDLYWYGIHGVETLFTLMGTGCQTVRRVSHPDVDIVVGEWADGRVGTFRGTRAGKHTYGGTAYGEEGVTEAGIYEGYAHLVDEIITFFQTGIPPVKKEETIEIYAFMSAADVSKKKGGKPVSLASVLKKAE